MELFLDKILECIECFVCLEYMQPPIFMCMKGHSICESCMKILVKCPLCGSSYLQARNYLLEKLAVVLHYPCPHNNCPKYVKLEDKEKHISTCQFRDYNCILGNEDNPCFWSDQSRYLENHAITEHGEKFWIDENIVYSIIPTEKEYNVQMISAHGEIFYLHRKVVNDIMHWVIQYIGNSQDSVLYFFELILFSDEYANRQQKFNELCQDDLCHVDEIIECGLCVGIPRYILETYTSSNGEINYEISIKKC